MKQDLPLPLVPAGSAPVRTELAARGLLQPDSFLSVITTSELECNGLNANP